LASTSIAEQKNIDVDDAAFFRNRRRPISLHTQKPGLPPHFLRDSTAQFRNQGWR
jgi:hypothetical protein